MNKPDLKPTIFLPPSQVPFHLQSQVTYNFMHAYSFRSLASSLRGFIKKQQNKQTKLKGVRVY